MTTKRNSPDIPDSSTLSEMYGAGFKLLTKMGYCGGGLGKSGEGISQPVEAVAGPSHGKGLGDSRGAVILELHPEDVDESGRKTDSVDNCDPYEPLLHRLRAATFQQENALRTANSSFLSCSRHKGTSDKLLSIDDTVAKFYQCTSVQQLANNVDLARDQFDSDPLWFLLDAESVVESLCLDLLTETLNTEGLDALSGLYVILRDLVLLDDDLADLVRSAASRSMKSIDWSNHGSARAIRIARLIGVELMGVDECASLSRAVALADPLRLISWLPPLLEFPGAHKWSEDHLVYRISTIESPDSLLEWKNILSPRAWRLTLRRFCDEARYRCTTSMHIFNDNPDFVMWRLILPPEAIGLVLSDTLLPAAIDIWQKIPTEDTQVMQIMFPRFRLLLQQLRPHCYFGKPAKRLLELVHVILIRVFGRVDLGSSGRNDAVSSRFPGKSHVADEAVSLRDVLDYESARLRLEFSPRVGYQEAGKQVYQFGSCLVYWSDSFLFFLDKETARWAEVSVDSLLAIANRG